MSTISRCVLPAAVLALLCAATGSQIAGPAQAAEAPSAGPSGTRPSVDADNALRKALAGLPAGDDGYAVAVADLATGDSATYSTALDGFDTASIVKADILAALLLQAQDRGEPLTAKHKRLARAMICSSDNAATATLWKAIGGSDALAAANKRLGLTETQPGPGRFWGLTQTTAADQLRLLQAVFGNDSPLSADSRAYMRKLMADVESDQRWGISAAGDSAALKNGWLSRTKTGLWDINSIGRIEHDGHTLLIAVLSEGQATQQKGIDVVERVAVAAAQAMTASRSAG